MSGEDSTDDSIFILPFLITNRDRTIDHDGNHRNIEHFNNNEETWNLYIEWFELFKYCIIYSINNAKKVN